MWMHLLDHPLVVLHVVAVVHLAEADAHLVEVAVHGRPVCCAMAYW